MGKADRISAVFVLLFAVFMGVQSYTLGLGTLRRPGPGFLFFWTSLALGVLCLVVFVRAWVERSQEGQKSLFAKGNTLKVVFVLASAFVYAALMEKVGFIPVTLMLFLFLLGFMEKKKWSFAVLVSVTVTILSYLIFDVWLKSQLPKGLLEFLRF